MMQAACKHGIDVISGGFRTQPSIKKLLGFIVRKITELK